MFENNANDCGGEKPQFRPPEEISRDIDALDAQITDLKNAMASLQIERENTIEHLNILPRII